MSDYKLPERTERIRDVSFPIPDVLLAITDESGRPAIHVRLGGMKQLPFTLSTEYSETPVTETPMRFDARNRLPLRTGAISVINDLVDTPTHKLPATSPTAAEYLALVGKPVLYAFSCVRSAQESDLAGKDIYRIERSTFILP